MKATVLGRMRGTGKKEREIHHATAAGIVLVEQEIQLVTVADTASEGLAKATASMHGTGQAALEKLHDGTERAAAQETQHGDTAQVEREKLHVDTEQVVARETQHGDIEPVEREKDHDGIAPAERVKPHDDTEPAAQARPPDVVVGTALAVPGTPREHMGYIAPVGLGTATSSNPGTCPAQLARAHACTLASRKSVAGTRRADSRGLSTERGTLCRGSRLTTSSWRSTACAARADCHSDWMRSRLLFLSDALLPRGWGLARRRTR